jgi:DNA-binding CsgD family transcriptional regulator
LRAARISPTGSAPPTIAVTLEEASPEERLSLFACASGLTPRESQVLRRLPSGATTRLIARGMALSEHTVHDHLKAIFAKSGSHSRAELLARALGGVTPGSDLRRPGTTTAPPE